MDKEKFQGIIKEIEDSVTKLKEAVEEEEETEGEETEGGESEL